MLHIQLSEYESATSLNPNAKPPVIIILMIIGRKVDFFISNAYYL